MFFWIEKPPRSSSSPETYPKTLVIWFFFPALYFGFFWECSRREEWFCAPQSWKMRLLYFRYSLSFAGDCAVLLQAGIPLRRVLLFNLLSASLAYCGTVVGVVVSKSTSDVTSWIFAITAGIFLYVALVDMVRTTTSFQTSLVGKAWGSSVWDHR